MAHLAEAPLRWLAHLTWLVSRHDTQSHPGERASFSNGQDPPRLISAENRRLQIYSDWSFANCRLVNVAFNNSRFERVYFRRAHFTRVNFTGCRFASCNFESAVFEECAFDYAELTNCRLKWEQIRGCLPAEPNLRRDFLRSLRANARERNRGDDERKMLLAEIAASRSHHWRQATDRHYRFYATRWHARASNMWALLKLIAFGWLFGYGERWLQVLFVGAIVISAFALGYSRLGLDIGLKAGTASSLSALDAVGYSAASFITLSYGDYAAHNTVARLATASEGVLGGVFFGVLVAAVYKRISHR